jgi:hypothetical protein
MRSSLVLWQNARRTSWMSKTGLNGFQSHQKKTCQLCAQQVLALFSCIYKAPASWNKLALRKILRFRIFLAIHFCNNFKPGFGASISAMNTSINASGTPPY